MSAGNFHNAFGEQRIVVSLFYPTAGTNAAIVARQWFLGATSRTATGSGGVTIGGAAPSTRALARRGAGGATMGGAARATIALARTGSGVATTGGAAAETKALLKAGAGGVAMGGAAAKAMALHGSGSGGLAVAGAAGAALALSRSGAGGATLGGAAGHSVTAGVHIVVVGSGGIVMGGRALVPAYPNERISVRSRLARAATSVARRPLGVSVDSLRSSPEASAVWRPARATAREASPIVTATEHQ